MRAGSGRVQTSSRKARKDSLPMRAAYSRTCSSPSSGEKKNFLTSSGTAKQPARRPAEERLHRQPRVLPKPPHRRAEHPAPGRRREQHGGGRLVRLEVLLHHPAAEGVPDKHRIARQAGGHLLRVAHVVGDRGPAQPLAASAPPVAAQAQGVRVEAVLREEVEEVLGPAPCTLTRAVHEQRRRAIRLARALPCDDLQVVCHERRVHPGQRAARARGRAPAPRPRLALHREAPLHL